MEHQQKLELKIVKLRMDQMKSKKLDENINRNDLVHESNVW